MLMMMMGVLTVVIVLVHGGGARCRRRSGRTADAEGELAFGMLGQRCGRLEDERLDHGALGRAEGDAVRMWEDLAISGQLTTDVFLRNL